MTQQGLYRLKPLSQRLVAPIAGWLVRRRAHPDLVTLSAVPVAIVGGICLAASPQSPWLLLLVPMLAAVRLGLNLLDGMVARQSGQAHPMGEMWNELGDRVADASFIGGLAWVPAVGPFLASAAVVAALLASFVGVTSRAAGARRQYGGVMSKPGRMATLAIAAPLAFFTGWDGWLTIAAGVIAVGAVVTLGQRLLDARRELE